MDHESVIGFLLLPGASQAGSSPRVAGMIVGIVLGAVLLILVVGYAIYKYRLRVSALICCVFTCFMCGCFHL